MYGDVWLLDCQSACTLKSKRGTSLCAAFLTLVFIHFLSFSLSCLCRIDMESNRPASQRCVFSFFSLKHLSHPNPLSSSQTLPSFSLASPSVSLFSLLSHTYTSPFVWRDQSNELSAGMYSVVRSKCVCVCERERERGRKSLYLPLSCVCRMSGCFEPVPPSLLSSSSSPQLFSPLLDSNPDSSNWKWIPISGVFVCSSLSSLLFSHMHS